MSSNIDEIISIETSLRWIGNRSWAEIKKRVAESDALTAKLNEFSDEELEEAYSIIQRGIPDDV